MIDKEYHGRVFDLVSDGGVMIYSYRSANVAEYLSDNEMLFRILTEGKLSPFMDDGRVRFNSNGNAHYRMADLSYACYHDYVQSFESWREDIQKFLDWKHDFELEIDHADSNIHNSTFYNLSIMDGSTNSRKASIVSRFKFPVVLNVAYVKGEYRLLINWNTVRTNVGPGCATMGFLCEDAEDLVQCLNDLSTIDPEWYHPLKVKGKWLENDRPFWSMDAAKSIVGQRILASMDRDRFDIYRAGNLSGALSIKEIKRVVTMERD